MLCTLDELAASLQSHRRVPSLVFMCGPAGTGKSFLLGVLEANLHDQTPRRWVKRLRADEFDELVRTPETPAWQDLVNCDVLLFDDVHLLRVRFGEQEAAACEWLVRLLDARQALDRPIVLTADAPSGRQSRLTSRLSSRIGSGVNLTLAPPGLESRLLFLKEFAQWRQLALPPSVLKWLAEHLVGSIRELEGAITRLQALTRLTQRVPDVEAVAREFREEIQARALTVERIAQRVSASFRVEPRQLQSRRRFTRLQTPRQVGMYLARRLTNLSLDEIGAYFGGRDHSTVLHACRKIEGALTLDTELSGVVLQLQDDLAEW